MSDNVTKVTQRQEPVKAKSFEESQGRFARDPAAASAAGKIGGPRAAAAYKRKNTLRKALAALLDTPARQIPGLEEAADALEAAGVDPTGADAVVYMQLIKAGRGDTDAARFVRDTVGERPSQAVELSASERTVDADAVADLTDDELAALAEDRRAALPAADPAQRFPAIVAPDVAPEEV
jgi:hypothetical protein